LFPFAWECLIPHCGSGTPPRSPPFGRGGAAPPSGRCSAAASPRGPSPGALGRIRLLSAQSGNLEGLAELRSRFGKASHSTAGPGGAEPLMALRSC
jgi:hypothetical protein